MKFLATVASLLLSAASAVTAADTTFAVGGQSLTVLGQSGGLKLTAADNDSYMQIKWERIMEIDASNQPIAGRWITNLASQSFTIDGPYATSYKGSDATRADVAVRALVNGGGANFYTNIAFNVLTFPNEVTVQNGATGQMITVPQNAVKFDVNITNWTFANPANKLMLMASIQNKGGKGVDATTVEDKNSNEKKIPFGQGSLDFPSLATVDGTTPAGVGVGVSSNAGVTSVIFVLPHFSNSLIYDPLLNTSSASAAAFSAVAMISMAILALMF